MTNSTDPDSPAPPGPLPAAAREALARVRIVLVRPCYGGNIGSVCRAMANMGLSDLALVAPAPFDRLEAVRMACWAGALLDGRREAATLAEAVADCGRVWGATARGGLYRRHVRAPRDWAPDILAVARENRVALVFGPEDDGLSNDDLELCNNLIRIPSSEGYTSLNLAQAVMICAYELFTAAGLFEPVAESSPEAPAGLRERMFASWRQALLDIGFMKEDKAQHMMLGLRRLLARAPLTHADVKILMGMARQTAWCAAERRRLQQLAEGGPTAPPTPPPGEDDEAAAPPP